MSREGDTDAKEQVRARIRRRRAIRPPALICEAGTALAERALPLCEGARRVAAYAAVAGEPPTGPLIDALRGRGVDVLLPVVDGDRLDWAVDRGDRVTGSWDVPEPVGERLGPDALGGCEVVFVPAMAVDRRGRRLGRGRGFYDRALARLNSSTTLTVAIVYDDEILDRVPVAPHDVPVRAAVTPSQVLDFTGRRGHTLR